jgi:hypothetical protein
MNLSRILLIPLMALVLVAVPTARASTNVVPNPGFEQGGGGASTPVICGWESTSGDPAFAFMGQDTLNRHSGGASMVLSGSYSASASTDPVFCAATGPGCAPSILLVLGGRRCVVGRLLLRHGRLHRDGFVPDSLRRAVRPWVRATPTISSFTPTSGPVGTDVTIRGTAFTGVPSITFNGTAASSLIIYSPTYITANVPAGATTGPISVTTPDGTAASSSSFAVTPPPPAPTIGSFTPLSGPVGTGVDPWGTNFTGVTSVSFNGTPDPGFVVNSSTDITAHVPAGATTGPITVTSPGSTATSSGSFTVTLPPPTITGFSPTLGHVGQLVTITGSNFTGAIRVELGTTSGNFTVNSSSVITATVPPIARGFYKWFSRPRPEPARAPVASASSDFGDRPREGRRHRRNRARRAAARKETFK